MIAIVGHREVYISNTLIDTCLWAIYRYLMSKYGVDVANVDFAPLSWYVKTGRASTDFLRRLAVAKPFMIGRILHRCGTTDEAVQKMKEYLYQETV